MRHDADLAAQRWTSDVYELRVLALLIDDLEAINVERAERQVEQLGKGQLAHVFASCDTTLATSSIALPLAEAWCVSDDAVRRQSGHTLVYELSKSKKKKTPHPVRTIASMSSNLWDSGEARRTQRAWFAGLPPITTIVMPAT